MTKTYEIEIEDDEHYVRACVDVHFDLIYNSIDHELGIHHISYYEPRDAEICFIESLEPDRGVLLIDPRLDSKIIEAALLKASQDV